MTAIVPSYLSKVSRAEKHLVELHEAIDAFIASKPYTVRKRIEGKKKPKTVHRVVFTTDPVNTDIPIIAADVVYNLRSALDHLMSCLVANKKRGSVIFPVFFEGAWDDPVPGDDEQRLKLQARWKSDTGTVKAPALTILKALQPPDDGGDGDYANRLRIINSLSNRDRHEKLPIVASGLHDFVLSLDRPDGKTYKGIAQPDVPSDFAQNEARLQIPEDAVNVEIEGTPLIVIRVGEDKRRGFRHVPLPVFLDEMIPFLKTRVITPLQPFVRR